MKSKMKSTFAIIAVALMIMVAVVPMIGVFTSVSDAATPGAGDNYADPKVGTITINGSVYSQEAKTEAVYVKVTWGPSSSPYVAYSAGIVPAVNGTAYTISIPENKITNVVVSVVTAADSTGVQIADYAPVSLGTLEKGTYEASLKSGYVTLSITFNMANDATVRSIFGNYIVSVNYTVFSAATGGTSVTGAATLDANSLFNIYVPASYVSENKAFVQVTGLSVKETAASTAVSKTINSLRPEAALSTVVASQYAVTFTSNAIDYTKLPSSTVTITGYTAATTNTVSANVYFFGPALATGGKLAGTVTYGNISQALVGEEDIYALANTLAENTYYYGTFQMGDLPAYDSQALSINLVNDTTVGSALTVFVKDGKYIAKDSSSTPAASSKLQVKATAFTVASIDNIGVDATTSITSQVVEKGEANVVVSNADYTKVTFTLKANDNATYEDASNILEELSITVSGLSSAFGAQVSSGSATIKTTAVNNIQTAYLFIKDFDKITISAASGEKFTLTASGPYVVSSSFTAVKLTVAEKIMYLDIKDGDGKAVTAGVTVKSTNYGDEFGENGLAAVYDNTLGISKVTVYQAYMDLANVKFYLVDANNTYTNSALAPETYGSASKASPKAITSLNTTYSIYLYSYTGQIYTDENLPFDFNTYSVYKSETGSLIFSAKTAFAGAAIDSNGKITIKAPSSYVNPTFNNVAKTVLVLEPKEAQTADYILEDYYFLETDVSTGKVMTVIASADYLFASVTRTDGTGIAQVTAGLYENANAQDPIATTVSDGNGDFALYSPTVIDEDFVVKFANADYTFAADYDVLDAAGEKVTEFAAKKDYYEITLTDLDDKAVTLTNNYVFTMNGLSYKVVDKKLTTTNVVENNQTPGAALTAGMVITPTYKNGNTVIRTFASYTVTEEDVATGVLDFTTLESTYTVFITDSEGAKLSTAEVNKIQVAAYQNGVIVSEPVEMTKATPITAGKFTAVLPVLDDDTEYMATVTNLANDMKYRFDTNEKYEFDDVTITIPSLYTTIYFGIEDAAGVELSVTDLYSSATLQEVFTVDTTGYADTPTVNKAVATNSLYFVGDASKTYQLTADWTVYTDATYNQQQLDYTDKYTIPDNTKITGGVVKALEQKTIFTVSDAIGQSVSLISAAFLFSTYKDDGTIVGEAQVIAVDLSGSFYAVFAKGTDYKYGLVDPLGVFTFPVIEDNEFVANETIMEPGFVSANGVDISAYVDFDNILTGVFAYAEDGSEIGSWFTLAIGNYIVVDVDEVAYYTVIADTEFDFVPQELPLFVATESIITGSVPASEGVAAANQRVELVLYHGTDAVASIDAEAFTAADPYHYIAFVDLTNYIDETAGVAFDSIIANYYESNVLVAFAVIDPYTQINNIYAPGHNVPILYDVINKTEGVCAGHTVAYVLNNVLILSADSVFYTPDEGYYTDGQYKYTFAGWYVNGVKVSANPDYAENIDSDVVAAAQYDVVYEKISDANAEKEKEIVEKEVPVGIDTNVLIIGICAVVIALIAVVYAVIKKE